MLKNESEKERPRGRERERERLELEKWQRFRTTSVAMAGPSNMEEGRQGGRRGSGEEQTKEKVVGCALRGNPGKEEERPVAAWPRPRPWALPDMPLFPSERAKRSLSSSLAFIYNSAPRQEPDRPPNHGDRVAESVTLGRCSCIRTASDVKRALARPGPGFLPSSRGGRRHG